MKKTSMKGRRAIGKSATNKINSKWKHRRGNTSFGGWERARGQDHEFARGGWGTYNGLKTKIAHLILIKQENEVKVEEEDNKLDLNDHNWRHVQIPIIIIWINSLELGSVQ